MTKPSIALYVSAVGLMNVTALMFMICMGTSDNPLPQHLGPGIAFGIAALTIFMVFLGTFFSEKKRWWLYGLISIAACVGCILCLAPMQAP